MNAYIGFIIAFVALFNPAQDTKCSCGMPIAAERSYMSPPAEVDLPYFDVYFRHSKGHPVELLAVRHEFSEHSSKRTMSGSVDEHTWKTSSNSKISSDRKLIALAQMTIWDPSNHEFGLRVHHSQIFMTNDRGRSWTSVLDHNLLEKPVILKGHAEAVAASEAHGLHSHYSIASWQGLQIVEMIFDINKSGTIYLLTNQGVFKSCNRAQSWNLLPVATEQLFSVRSIAINPMNSANLAIGTTDGVYISRDGGCSFEVALL
ncbi:MAG: hypothetical protein DMG65_10095 [Candidatus Angelobacter sp. Gp1-AA117]|nr:MAG: hypothetical protein DMG65_10095 [Candidatus Angelobacter sp. Gp1-AA117]